MENNTDSTKSIALNYGLTLGVASVLLAVIMYMAGTDFAINNGWINTVVSLAIMIGIITLGIKKYRENNNGYISLRQSLKVGIAIALIAGIISAIYTLVFTSYIDPSYMTTMQELQLEKALEQNPNMSEQQIEMMQSMTSKTSSPGFIFGVSLLASLFLGFIISLISGLILKKTEDSIDSL